MKKNLILLLIFLVISCKTENDLFYSKTDEKYEIIDGEKKVVSEITQTYRKIDSLPISKLEKTSNFSNDLRMKNLTGLEKENGLQNYLLDSIYYDKFKNDTLKKCFVFINKKWELTQLFHKKFNQNRKVEHFMTERPFNKKRYYKKETFYIYNNSGKIVSETELECSEKTICDSIFKRKYIYDSNGKLEMKISYIWENKKWTELNRKNGS